MRGCDSDEAIYWLKEMIDSRGTEIYRPKDGNLCIGRRRFSKFKSINFAISCFEECEKIVAPECFIDLAHVRVFLATTQKSNCSGVALNACRDMSKKLVGKMLR
jgi:replication-associated recombination protein RarA